MDLSFIVLVKVGLYMIVSSCYYLLFLYVFVEYEESVLEVCKDIKYDEYDEFFVEIKMFVCMEVVLVILFGISCVGIWYVIQFWVFDVILSILFVIGLFLQMVIVFFMFGKLICIFIMLWIKFCFIFIVVICLLVNMVVYMFVVIVIIWNWYISGFSFKGYFFNLLLYIG